MRSIASSSECSHLHRRPCFLRYRVRSSANRLVSVATSTRSPLAARFLTSSSSAGNGPGRLDTDQRIDQSGRADHLLDDLAAGHRDLVISGSGRDEEPPCEVLLPRIHSQGPVVQGLEAGIRARP